MTPYRFVAHLMGRNGQDGHDGQGMGLRPGGVPGGSRKRRLLNTCRQAPERVRQTGLPVSPEEVSVVCDVKAIRTA